MSSIATEGPDGLAQVRAFVNRRRPGVRSTPANVQTGASVGTSGRVNLANALDNTYERTDTSVFMYRSK